jgi:TolB-like protein
MKSLLYGGIIMRKIFFRAILTVIILLSYSNFLMAYEKAINNISSTLAENIARSGKKMIAVVDFTDLQGNVTELGRFLAEELSVSFAGAGKGFEVVDRTHLMSILAEHKLSATGIIDPQTARKLGQIAGVDALITGSITPFGDSVRLSVKILDTSTARIIGTSSGDVAKTKAIEELLAKGVETGANVTGSMQTVSSPVEPKAMAKVEIGDFTFEGKQCNLSGRQVICDVAVTNNAPQIKRLAIYTSSILVDDRGSQYIPTGVSFSGGDIPPGLPMNITIRVGGIDPNAKYGNVILRCFAEKEFTAVIRNIPFSR